MRVAPEQSVCRWLLAGKEPVGERLVDDQHPRMALIVAIGEFASLDERCADSPEVLGDTSAMFEDGRSLGPVGRSSMLNETGISFPVNGSGIPAVADGHPGTAFSRSSSRSMNAICPSFVKRAPGSSTLKSEDCQAGSRVPSREVEKHRAENAGAAKQYQAGGHLRDDKAPAHALVRARHPRDPFASIGRSAALAITGPAARSGGER